MQKRLILVLIIFLCSFVAAGEYLNGEVLVKYKDKSTFKFNAEGLRIEKIHSKSFYKIKVDDVEEAIKEYKKNPNVEYVQPNYIYNINLEPNDSSYSLQWALPNINANKAWNITTGRSDIVIAVIDTGVKWDHPDLNNNIWINEDEIPDNNIDDDGNGYVDDVRGYNFVSADYSISNIKNDPMDNNGHGTHVAGIIASEMNDDGVVGICPSCKIMALRAGNNNGEFSTGDIVNAVNYAIFNNATIISMSFGGDISDNPTLEEALGNAYNTSIILVASAGNDNSDKVEYPANYSFVVAVGATDENSNLSSFSNYGKEVEIAAPGNNVYSTYINPEYEYMSGTSMSCPYISGSIGLILSYFVDVNREINQTEIVNVLNLTGVDIGYHFKRIDIFEAFKVLDYSGPEIKLISPKNLSYNYNENLELNFSIYDINDINATWYNLNGDNIILNGNILFNTTDGDHLLKVYGNDSLGNEGLGEVNFLVDAGLPIINLNEINNSNNASIVFEYSVDDIAINNCSLIINDEINKSNENITINNTEIFNVILSDGDYNYSIKCVDHVGNENTSIVYNLNISCMESWECSSWSDSSNNCGTRQCADYNYCGTIYNKPSESNSCPVFNSGEGGGGGGGGGGSSSNRNNKVIEEPEPKIEEVIIPEEYINSNEEKEEKKEEEVKVEEKSMLMKIFDKIKDLIPGNIPTGEAVKEKRGVDLFMELIMNIFNMFKSILFGS